MSNLLKIGASGPLVLKIQQILNQKGLICPLSSVYDQITTDEVKAFQTSNSLVSDGIVGPMTWLALINESNSSKIDAFCHAIQEREGFYAPGENPQYPHGTPAWINNNPGDINWDGQANAVQNGRFAKFDTYADGYACLKNLVIRACTGQSNIYHPFMTIQEFFNIYSPSNDGNDPISYALQVANYIGCVVGTQIKDLL